MADETIEVKLKLIDNMSNEIKATRAAVESNLTKMRQDAERAKTGFGQFAGGLKSGLAGALSFLGPTAIAATAVTTAIRTMGKAFGDANTLFRMNAQLGISTNLLNVLDDAARHVGGNLESMTMGIKGFEVALVEAQKAGSKENEVLKALGVTLTNDVEKDFKATIIALSKITDQHTRAAAATALFGRSALEILPALEEIAANIDNINAGMSQETIQSLHEGARAWSDFWDGVVEQTGTGLAAVMNFFKKTQEAAKNPGAVIPGLDMTTGAQSTIAGANAPNKTQTALERALAGVKDKEKKPKAEPVNIYGETAEQEKKRIDDQYQARVDAMNQELELGQNVAEANELLRAQNLERVEYYAQQQAEIEQIKNDVIYSGSMDIVRSMGAVTQAMAKNSKQRKAAALIETAAYGGVSSALAWKEAFAQKDTGGFYGKLAAAIIGTGAAVANMVVAIANINKYARGGYAKAGYAIVGEEGPELVRFGGGANVMTAGATRQILNDNRRSEATFVFNDSNGREIDRLRVQIRNGSADSLVSELRSRMRLQVA